MTDATRPVKLSGPQDLKIESMSARAPLPEIGRNSMRGIVSLGIAIKLPIGASNEVTISRAPEALSIEIATIKPINDGAIEKVEASPSFAPEMKVSKSETLLKRPKRIIKPIVHGIM